jgi:hypothetical protein
MRPGPAGLIGQTQKELITVLNLRLRKGATATGYPYPRITPSSQATALAIAISCCNLCNACCSPLCKSSSVPASCADAPS